MAIERIETGKIPQIEVSDCAGDLIIRPWMEMAIQAKGDFQVEQVESSHFFSSAGDLRLFVPEEAAVKVQNVRGDLSIKSIRGDVSLGDVRGDAILVGLGMVKVGEIHGDLAAKNLEGPLSIEWVHGDAVARNIDGMLSAGVVHGDFAAYYVNGDVRLDQGKGDINLKTVNGEVSINSGSRDVNLRNLGGICSVHRADGDIRLKGGLCEGEHTLTASGDIVVRWPANAPLHVVAMAPEVRNRLPLQDLKNLDGGLVGRLGDGGTAITLTADGRIVLKEERLVDEKWETGQKEAFDMDFMTDLAGLGERVAAEVNHHMARFGTEIENYFGPDFAQNISEKVSWQAEKAARKAEAAAEKAHRYAEREAARAAKYAPPPPRPRKAQTAARKASTEEQLKILRMVEKGTISPDEASTLLQALEQ